MTGKVKYSRQRFATFEKKLADSLFKIPIVQSQVDSSVENTCPIAGYVPAMVSHFMVRVLAPTDDEHGRFLHLKEHLHHFHANAPQASRDHVSATWSEVATVSACTGRYFGYKQIPRILVAFNVPGAVANRDILISSMTLKFGLKHFSQGRWIGCQTSVDVDSDGFFDRS